MSPCDYEIPKSVQELIHSLVDDVMKAGNQSISIDITSTGPTVRIYPWTDDEEDEEEATAEYY